MSEHLEFKIGGKDYKVGLLTVGQLERLQLGIVKANSTDPEQGTRDWWEQTRGMLAAALSEDYPDIDEAAVRKMRFRLKDLIELRNEILIFAGLIDREGLEEAERKLREKLKAGEAPSAGEQQAAAA